MKYGKPTKNELLVYVLQNHKVGEEFTLAGIITECNQRGRNYGFPTATMANLLKRDGIQRVRRGVYIRTGEVAA